MMTIEKATAPAEDLHPRRPDMIERMTRHMLCCVYWRVAAGSCDKSNQAAGKGGSAAQPQADTESGSAQWIDYEMARKRLRWLEEEVLKVVIEREAIDRVGGDPGGYGANDTWSTGTDGLDLSDRYLFWQEFGRLVAGGQGNYDISTLVEVEESAYTRVALALGWRPPQ